MTRNRQLVYETLRQSCSHVTADEIYLKLKRENHRMVYATVYNCLNYLIDQKMIRKISLSGQADRYDWNLKPHDHFICRKCGCISDVPFVKSIDETSKIEGNLIENYETIYHGICQNCLKEQFEEEK